MTNEVTDNDNAGYFRKRNWPRILVAIVLLLVGLYLGNHAIFNLWQSAFQENKPYLDILETRFWVFASLSLVFIAASVTLVVLTIKKVNRESKLKGDRSI